MLLFQVSGAERLEEPVSFGWHVSDDVVSVDISVTEVGTGSCWAALVTGSNWLSIEIVGLIDHLTNANNHVRGRAIMAHELRHQVTIIVDVLDVRSTHGEGSVVHMNRVRLLAKRTIRFRLEDDTNSLVVNKVGSHTIGNTNKFLAFGAVASGAFAHGGDNLDVSMGEISITGLTILRDDTSGGSISSFAEKTSVGSDGIAVFGVLIVCFKDVNSSRNGGKDINGGFAQVRKRLRRTDSRLMKISKSNVRLR